MDKRVLINNINAALKRTGLRPANVIFTTNVALTLLGYKDGCVSAEGIINTETWVSLINKGFKSHNNHLLPSISLNDLKVDLRLDSLYFKEQSGTVEGVVIFHPAVLLHKRQRDMLVTEDVTLRLEYENDIEILKKFRSK